MTTERIQRILVPTDLSDFSKSAAAWAAMFHRYFDSRVLLLYADEPYVPFDVLEGPAAYFLQAQSEFRLRLSDELKKFQAECFPDGESFVETVVVEGAPARAIIDTANKFDADLILMGTHGRRGWTRMLLGSVTEHVVRATDRPLLSVPASATPYGPKVEKILCPVNFTGIGRQALEEAVALAAAFAADLLVVHVADPIDEPAFTHLEEDFAAWVEPGVRQRCKYLQIVARGDAEQVLEIANQAGADLIVIGAQHRRFSDTTIIGTTTERVVRFAKQPVWTVVSRAAASTHDRARRAGAVTAG